jgi:hypothetical protein
VNDPQGDPVGDAPDVEGLRRLVGGLDPGLSHVDDISAGALPSGHTLRPWGSAIEHPDGRIEIDLNPMRSPNSWSETREGFVRVEGPLLDDGRLQWDTIPESPRLAP